MDWIPVAGADDGIVALALAALYTRIPRDGVWGHVHREAILRWVAENPGRHLRGLQRDVGIGWGQFHYHLGVLVRAQLLRLERDGARVTVWPAESTSAPVERPVAGVALRIVEAVAASDGVTRRTAATRAGISLQLATYHLARLEESGLLRSDPSRPKRYYLKAARSPTHLPPPSAT